MENVSVGELNFDKELYDHSLVLNVTPGSSFQYTNNFNHKLEHLLKKSSKETLFANLSVGYNR